MNTLGTYMDICGLTEEASLREGGVWYSEPEIRLAEELTRRGFGFEQQKRVKRGDTTAVLDFWVENMLAVEVDGKDFHRPVEDQARDFALLTEHGFRTMRVRGWRVMRDAEGVVCRIALRLAELGFESKPLEEKVAA